MRDRHSRRDLPELHVPDRACLPSLHAELRERHLPGTSDIVTQSIPLLSVALFLSLCVGIIIGRLTSVTAQTRDGGEGSDVRVRGLWVPRGTIS